MSRQNVYDNDLEDTIKALFSEPFGGGYPKNEAKRKISDATKLKEIKTKSQISFHEYIDKIDEELLNKVRILIERGRR